MKPLFSAFTGYNLRELLLPLAPLLSQDTDTKQVYVVTPAAGVAPQVFPDLNEKFVFLKQQKHRAGYEQLLTSFRPDIVVTPTNGLEPRDLPLIKAAQRLSIPTLTFIASWDNVYKIERKIKLKKYQSAYAIPDHFAVWNQFNHNHLYTIFPQLKSDQVTIVGTPRLDYLSQPWQLPSRAQLMKTLGFSDHNKKLVHLATTELYLSDYLVTALHGAADLRDQINIFVSVHPGGNKVKHAQYAEPLGAKVEYSFGRQRQPAHPDFVYAPTLADIKLHAALFKHADLLINHSSTVTIESIIADTPVINVKYGRPFDWWHWYRSMVYRDFKQHAKIIIDSNATQVVTSRSQLITATQKYLRNPRLDGSARAALAQRMITYTDGQAGRRLLDLIKKIAHPDASS